MSDLSTLCRSGAPPSSTRTFAGLDRRSDAAPPQAARAHANNTLAWPAMNRALDSATCSRARGDNEVSPLFNGNAGWPARLQQLADASIILIKTYEFIDDSAGRDMVARLRARARAGALVVVQYDFKGSAEFPRYTILRSHPQVFRPLLGEPNVLLVPCYMPRHWQYLALPCCHKKYFLTMSPDRPATLLMGGMNVANAYCYGGAVRQRTHRIHGYRDTDVLVRGPVVADAVDDFLQDLQKRAPGEAERFVRAVRAMVGPRTFAGHPKAVEARLVVSAPRDKSHPHRMPRMFEQLLSNVPGGQTVLISNAFFSPMSSTRRVMVAAARRGVRFIILNNAQTVHDKFGRFMGFIAHGVMRRLMRQVPEGSMRLFEWHSCEQDSLCSIHQKVTVFGDTGPVWVGSANLDTVSAERNHESVLLLQDTTTRHHFTRQFHDDLCRDNVREVTPAALARESFWQWYGEALALLVFRRKV